MSKALQQQVGSAHAHRCLSPGLQSTGKWLVWASLLAALPLAAANPPALREPATQAEDVVRCFELRRSEPKAAIAMADALLAKPQLPLETEIKALSCLGTAAGTAGDSERAAEAGYLILERVKAHPELPPEFTLRALSNAGAAFHAIGQIHQAEMIYQQVNEVAKRVDAKDAAITQAVTLTNIGLIHADYLDSPEVADDYYRQALAAAESVDYQDLPLLYNHAVNLITLGKDEEALSILGQIEQTGPGMFQQRARSERAGLLIGAGHYAQALPLLEAALRLQPTFPDPAGEADSLARLSALQLAKGEPAKALATAEHAWRLVDDSASLPQKNSALQARLNAHVALGQTAPALAVAEQLHALQTETLKQQRLELLADLQSHTENVANEREVQKLRHDAQTQALRLEKANLLRNAILALLGILLLAGAALLLLQRSRQRQLEEISAIDSLTGLSNRRAATRALNSLTQRRGPPAPGTRHVLFLIDVDHFKKINDTHGHHAGDNALVKLARQLRDACRPGDIIARWGGEEFLVGCLDLTQDKACAVAVRLSQAMNCTIELLPGQSQTLTVSLGFAPFPFFADVAGNMPACRWDYAIRMADRALYAAKDHRNAWAGMWGAQVPPGASQEEILEHPEATVRAGDIDVMASYPMTRR